MIHLSKEELTETLFVIASIVGRCENAQTKFREGTSQHTLLKNRIRALYLSKELVETELLRMGERLSAVSCEVTGKCEALDNCEILGEGSLMEELKSTVPPIVSIISKCEKAQSKYEKGTAQFRRYEKIIHAMKVSKTLLEDRLETSAVPETSAIPETSAERK
ncbi:hypothetical protein [Hungatella hathewayi]|uniref:hypothetical protein n=1 Tax=Hungatella hathewayi TaxID=154046 RepID=UPI00356ACCD0